MKRTFALVLTLCLLLGALPFTASAAETVTLAVTKTNVKADGVANYDGYGSLRINGNGAALSQTALIDKAGKLLFPYRETPARFVVDGDIVSFSTDNNSFYGAVENNNDAVLYRLDGSVILSLPSHDEEFEIKNPLSEFSDVSYHTRFLAGPMTDGFSVIVKEEEYSYSGGGVGSVGRQYSAYIIDESGKTVCELPEEFTKDVNAGGMGVQLMNSVGLFSEGLAMHSTGRYDADGNWVRTNVGYIDSTGKTVLDLSDRGYKNAGPFSDGLAWVVNQDNLAGYIDKTGKEVIPCQYTNVWGFSDGNVAVQNTSGKFGTIDKNGNTVIPFEYDNSFGSGDEGIMTVGNGGKYGLVDRSNNIILPLEYDDISTFENGVAYAIKDGYVYVIAKDDTPANPTVGGFKDVYVGDFYADAVVWAVENKVTSGTGDGTTFSPTDTCTRGQIVTFLWRAMGSPAVDTDVSFSDVEPGAYYEQAVKWAVANNVTAGTGDGSTFSPDSPCDRAQAVTFMWRANGKPAASGSSFGDVQSGSYYEDAVKWAVSKNITSGTSSTTFSPTQSCARGQIVTFLYRNK